ncbi:hypothetical protein TPY_0263 [Sulfobacillus acidophilus TPY]|nr:hypothetical protein TPY_0263 [Sulfobacillus acidophilus TPY]
MEWHRVRAGSSTAYAGTAPAVWGFRLVIDTSSSSAQIAVVLAQ